MPVIGDQVGLTLDRIILATDFSPAAEKATGYAQGLAKRFASSLTLAHVIDLSVATRSEDAVVGLPIDEVRHDSAENQERLLSDMTMAGVRAMAHTVESHNPAAAVVGFAKELRADLIVTGTNARHGLSKAILGSFAEGIIRHASCPVLTIGPKAKPAPKEGFSFHTVVFATDFSSNAALEAAVALSFAQDSVAQIYLYHVLDKPGKDICDTVGLELKFEEELGKLIPRSAYDWCSPERVVDGGAVAPGILALAKKVDADLIVLGAKHSGTWYTHLVEGTVGKVLTGAECPVITVCAK
jgi:nucleotide-binding universal stress UspA family protein